MLGTRYEEYEQLHNGFPFVLYPDIKRNRYNLSKETNWHENLELQFCVTGSGTVLLDGEAYPFSKETIAVVNPNVIHYTGTEEELVYDALIISTDFYRQMDLRQLSFAPMINNPAITDLFHQLKTIYLDLSVAHRTAKLHKLLLEMMIELAQSHSVLKPDHTEKNKRYERIKLAIFYIRKHYQQKITLDEIAKAVFCDKYALCKDFKKYTGQTVFENLNNYRCIKAVDCLAKGHTVAEAASLCGFNNFSFFTRTFKKHIGKHPSEYKK